MSPEHFEFDIIITTYKRPKEVCRFANEILKCTLKPKNLIIIDSSDEVDKVLDGMSSIIYIQSSIKSQPYQRYLGVLASKSKYVILFDDDLIIKDEKIFEYFKNGYDVNENIVGVSVRTELYNPRNVGIKVKSFKNKPFKRFIYKALGYKLPKTGKLSIGGFAGPLPEKPDYVEKFGGGNMSFKREIALQLFDNYLFALFEKKLAMGEDKVICARANKFGKLYHIPVECLIHPPIHSHYKNDDFSFIRKTQFSRLWLSLEISRAKLIPSFIPYLHYFYHTLMLFLISVLQLKLMKAKALFSGALQNITVKKSHILENKNYQEYLERDLERYSKQID